MRSFTAGRLDLAFWARVAIAVVAALAFIAFLAVRAATNAAPARVSEDELERFRRTPIAIDETQWGTDRRYSVRSRNSSRCPTYTFAEFAIGVLKVDAPTRRRIEYVRIRECAVSY